MNLVRTAAESVRTLGPTGLLLRLLGFQVSIGAHVTRVERTQFTAERALPPLRNRLADAEEWLGGLLKAWGVRSSSTGRWLSAAQAELESNTELVIFVQYDALMLLFTVELWASGQRVYGIDDWLG